MEKRWKKQEPVTFQRTTDVHPRFGTDESVPYAKHNFFRFNNPPVICGQGGMHKCIPYENSVNAPYPAESQ